MGSKEEGAESGLWRHRTFTGNGIKYAAALSRRHSTELTAQKAPRELFLIALSNKTIKRG